MRKLAPYAEAAKKRGLKIYHLNIGQPDIETPEIALNKVKNSDLKVIEYSHSAGIESYRRRLVEYYKRYDINIDYTDILVTTGGSEAIVFAFMSALNPDDEVIIPEPFYANYNGFAVMAGITIKPITSTIENGFALPPISEFEKRFHPKPKGFSFAIPTIRPDTCIPAANWRHCAILSKSMTCSCLPMKFIRNSATTVSNSSRPCI